MKTKLKNLLKELSERSTINNQYEVLTSSQNGIVSQTEYFNKQIASVQNIGYKIIRKGQFTYRSMSDTGLFFINRLTAPEIGIVSPAYPVFEIISDDLLPEYLELFFRSTNFQHQISTESTGSTRLALKYNKLCDLEINVPSLCIQSEIVNNINVITNVIDLEKKQLKLYDELIKSRFIEMFGDVFYNDNRYNQVKIRDIVKYEQPTKYIVSSEEYNNSYETPVLTAGKNFILGYTKEKNGIFIGSKEKVIIFDDFTCDSKIVNFDFKVKSSAIKILHMKKGVNIDFFYNVLKQHHYNVANHKRHWISTFEIMKIGLPPLKLQNKYASFVEQIDKSKFIVQKRIDTYKELLAKKMDEYFN